MAVSGPWSFHICCAVRRMPISSISINLCRESVKQSTGHAGQGLADTLNLAACLLALAAILHSVMR